ncbi:MAG: Tryptophan--tRNA ligase, mitochondrial [Bathelium mastoideum]|nr:MAG: Tryptophan--tRNA ligase, mitochondrial [Bathelium mastoideum]
MVRGQATRTRFGIAARHFPKTRTASHSCLNSTRSKTPQVIFSGIQPTGIPHLGNYLGALKQWVKLQNNAAPNTTLLYSVVDLHALTAHDSPVQLRQCRQEMLAALLAVGLDPQRSIIFYQSTVPAHTDLMWILSSAASMGYLSRMTQWKSKLDLPDNASPFDPTVKAKLKLGLFSYPVLQAADILVHRATHVPVGHDQSQHLEFARECANGFNHNYGRVLVAPDTLLSPAKRVMSLTEPHLKMSKSHANPKSRILITDGCEEIEKKIKGALTDSVSGISYDLVERPGVSNLLDIMFHLQDDNKQASLEELVKDCVELTPSSDSGLLLSSASGSQTNERAFIFGSYTFAIGAQDASRNWHPASTASGAVSRDELIVPLLAVTTPNAAESDIVRATVINEPGSAILFRSSAPSVDSPAVVIDANVVIAIDDRLKNGSTTLVPPSIGIDPSQLRALVPISGKNYVAVETASDPADIAAIGCVTLTVDGAPSATSGETLSAALDSVSVDGTRFSCAASATNEMVRSLEPTSTYVIGTGPPGSDATSSNISPASGKEYCGMADLWIVFGIVMFIIVAL